MVEIIARRQFDPLFIIVDCVFLLIFVLLLVWKKRYTTLIVGFLAGVIYVIVDYGIFHLALKTRSIADGYSMFWVLLWMSMSYGFTNFTWIWLWIRKDKYLLEWSLLILSWWLCGPMLADTFGYAENDIWIQRTTSSYHGVMAILLFVGYLGLFIWNFKNWNDGRINILWLLAIGILVQFGWEAGLLIGGIRSAGFESFEDKIMTLVTNSLLETNLGMPYIYFIYIALTKNYDEQLKKQTIKRSFIEVINDNRVLTIKSQKQSTALITANVDNDSIKNQITTNCHNSDESSS